MFAAMKNELSDTGLSLPEIRHSQLVFNEQYIKVRRDTIHLRGEEHQFFALQCTPRAAVVLATTHEGHYLLNWEYRYALQRQIYTLPGGSLEEGEEWVEGAQREMLEETGYSAERFELLGTAFPFSGVCGQEIAYVRAYGAHWVGPQKLDPVEVIEPRLLSPSQLRSALNSGQPFDGGLLIALGLEQQKRQ
jgi:ADP-ribose pyrophosphatase